MKQPRNQLCTCGSGKKFKRCCLVVSVKGPAFYAELEAKRLERVAKREKERQQETAGAPRRRRGYHPVYAAIAAIAMSTHSGRYEGVSGRVGLLRGYGNAIVPQLAALFIEASREALR